MKSLSLTKPHMIVMVGIPGSGKSFFAEKFSNTFHAPYINYQKVSSLAQDNAEKVCFYLLDELLKTQQTIIFDGLSNTRTERIELARRAKDADYEPLFIWTQTDLATAKARIVTPKKGISSDEYDQLHRRFTPPSQAEKPLVISGKHTYATQAKVVLQKISTPRAEISTHRNAPVREQPTGRRNITIR